jgi:hypothetical protein
MMVSSSKNDRMERRMSLSKLFLMLPFVVTGCGVAPGDDVQVSERLRSETETEVDIVQAHVDIPPRVEGDWRGPIERYIGVPVQVDDANQWDHDLMQAALMECMKSKGFSYFVSSYDVATGSVQVATDPNSEYFAQLAPSEQERYAQVRWADAAGCEVAASNRVHLLNIMAAEYMPFEERLYGDESVQRAIADIRSCVESGGSQAECERTSNWQLVVQPVREVIETEFVIQYQDMIDAFVNDLPKVSL